MRRFDRLLWIASLGGVLLLAGACGGEPQGLDQLGAGVAAFVASPEEELEPTWGSAILEGGLEARWETTGGTLALPGERGRVPLGINVELSPSTTDPPDHSTPLLVVFLKCHSKKLHCYLGGFELAKHVLREVDPETNVEIRFEAP